jgi:hypothetical protein
MVEVYLGESSLPGAESGNGGARVPVDGDCFGAAV